MSNMPKHVEFECKYRVEPHLLIEFKKIMNSNKDPKEFTYVEGPDTYFTHSNIENGFGRYRCPSYGLDNGRAEFTVKVKPADSKNSIIREELNWRVDGTPEDAIMRLAEISGFVFNFSIYKACQIFKFADATVVFYTVYDTTDNKTSKADSFLEIEVDEATISTMSEDQAYAIIEKYEKMLSPLGLNPQRRMRKSLFELFKR